MGTFGRSYVRSKDFTFSQQIEKFPWHLRRGKYVSPKYHSESIGCDWRLIIEPKRESFLRISSDYIEMRLKREDFCNDFQSVKVKLTIVDSSFLGSDITKSKEIHFMPTSDEEIVVRLKKSALFDGFIGLNKIRYVPNGVLTVKCEITVYEIVEDNYTSEDQFLDVKMYAKKEIVKCLWHLLWISVLMSLPCSLLLGFVFGIVVAFGTLFGLFGIYIFIQLLLKKVKYLLKEVNDTIYNVVKKLTNVKTKTN